MRTQPCMLYVCECILEQWQTPFGSSTYSGFVFQVYFPRFDPRFVFRIHPPGFIFQVSSCGYCRIPPVLISTTFLTLLCVILVAPYKSVTSPVVLVLLWQAQLQLVAEPPRCRGGATASATSGSGTHSRTTRQQQQQPQQQQQQPPTSSSRL